MQSLLFVFCRECCLVDLSLYVLGIINGHFVTFHKFLWNLCHYLDVMTCEMYFQENKLPRKLLKLLCTCTDGLTHTHFKDRLRLPQRLTSNQVIGQSAISLA